MGSEDVLKNVLEDVCLPTPMQFDTSVKINKQNKTKNPKC